MTKNIIIAVLFIIMIISVAYAMAPMPICYFTAANVCSNVTTANPLPIVSN